MLKGVVKFVGITFLVFLILGNLTAPAELESDYGKPSGVMGAFYEIGKFIILPFQNVAYRLSHRGYSYSYNAFPDEQVILRTYPLHPTTFTTQPFIWHNKTYTFLMPRGNYKPFPLRMKPRNWNYSDIKDILNALNSTPVNRIFNFAMALIFDNYFNKSTYDWYFRTYMHCKPPTNPVFVTPKDLNLPLTLDIVTSFYLDYVNFFVTWGKGTPKSALANKIIGKNSWCADVAFYDYQMLMKLYNTLGVNAYYVGVGMNPIVNGQETDGHEILIVYYPEIGRWAIVTDIDYSIFHYFEKYRTTDFKHVYWNSRRDLFSVYYLTQFDPYVDSSTRPPIEITPGSVYVPSGYLYFRTFREALYWYLHVTSRIGTGPYFYVSGYNPPVGTYIIPKFNFSNIMIDIGLNIPSTLNYIGDYSFSGTVNWSGIEQFGIKLLHKDVKKRLSWANGYIMYNYHYVTVSYLWRQMTPVERQDIQEIELSHFYLNGNGVPPDVKKLVGGGYFNNSSMD